MIIDDQAYVVGLDQPPIARKDTTTCQSSLMPVPLKGETFMAIGENKADLSGVLSHQLITQASQIKTILFSGFKDEEHVDAT